MWGIWNTSQKKWVAVQGWMVSFTTGGKDNRLIRRFDSKEQAQNECCGDEYPRQIEEVHA